jgi:hypothetical protein
MVEFPGFHPGLFSNIPPGVSGSCVLSREVFGSSTVQTGDDITALT